jgi:hypothetical protein
LSRSRIPIQELEVESKLVDPPAWAVDRVDDFVFGDEDVESFAHHQLEFGTVRGALALTLSRVVAEELPA